MSRHKPHSPSAISRPAPTPTSPSQSPIASGPTHQQIALRAYELFLARGGRHGRADADWYQAERELKLGRQ